MLVEMNSTPELVSLPAERKEMLSVRREGEKTFVRINSSSLSILQECWRKSYYSLERGLQAKRESPATLYGSAIHKALETFYAAPKAERILPPKFLETTELMGAGAPATEAEEEFLVLRSVRAFLTLAEPLRNLPDSDKRSLSAGAWTLFHYFKTYIDDPYVIYCDGFGPLIEKKVESVVFDDGKLQIVLFGTIDCILENPDTQTVLICDHKTSSVVGEQFYARLKPNHQYTAYILLAEKALGLKTDKFMVNCIQVKPKVKTARGTPPHFPRQVTTRSEEDVQEFLDSLEYYVREFLRQKEAQVWPLSHVSACASYNGCQYLKVCGSPKVIRENIIKAEFHEEKR